MGEGKLEFMSGGIGSIQATDGSCMTSAGSDLYLNFGVNQSWSCHASTNPCAGSFYVDTLAAGTLDLKKYATGTEAVNIVGLTENSCSKQSITLNIVYSSAGWLLDPQYYIMGAVVTLSSGPDPTWTQKYFNVKWLYADPSTISSPPTNSFYEYFSLLWQPLQTRFDQYTA